MIPESMTYQKFQQRYTYNPATDCLGEGGFGKVYKVYDEVRNRTVALKIAEVKQGAEEVRLKIECEKASNLPEHLNIAYYEECHTFVLPTGEYDFGILQYYEEGNLLDLLKNQKLSITQKQNILLQLLDGIEFLHNHQIIHRDLKPQNILIAKRHDQYIPKITDFGISKKIDSEISSAFSNSLMGAGTFAYASPEQLKAAQIRKNSDLWSFGIIAFRMLTDELPFTSGDYSNTSEAGRQELFRQINDGKLPASIHKIQEPWKSIVTQCLIPDPKKRISSCNNCHTILKNWEENKKQFEQLTQKAQDSTVLKNYEEALNYYQKALNIFPEDKVCNEALKKCKREKEQYTKLLTEEAQKQKNERQKDKFSLIKNEKLRKILNKIIGKNSPIWFVLFLISTALSFLLICIVVAIFILINNSSDRRQESISNYELKIETLERQVDVDNEVKQQLEQEIDTLKTNTGNIPVLAGEKEMKIIELSQEIAVLKKDNAKLKANQMDQQFIDDLNNKINDLRSELYDKDKTIARYEKTIKDLSK